MPECPKCNSSKIVKKSKTKLYLWYFCKKCNLLFTLEAIAFAKRIRRIRVALNLTQAELAFHLDVSIARISSWEKGLASKAITRTMLQIEKMERQIEETGTVEVYRSKNRYGPRF